MPAVAIMLFALISTVPNSRAKLSFYKDCLPSFAENKVLSHISCLPRDIYNAQLWK